MAWGGIQNLPPGFDVFGGRRAPTSIVDDAAKGQVDGLSPARQEMFVDLKRNLLRRDFARYFDGCIPCAEVLAAIQGGVYLPRILSELIEPALAVGIEQMVSIRQDVERAKASGRKLEYDAGSSLQHLYGKSLPIAKAYPQAQRGKELEATYAEVLEVVRAATSA